VEREDSKGELSDDFALFCCPSQAFGGWGAALVRSNLQGISAFYKYFQNSRAL
jgi:hypothetical protein